MANIKIGDRVELVKVAHVSKVLPLGAILTVIRIDERDKTFEAELDNNTSDRNMALWMARPDADGVIKPLGMNHEFKILGVSNERHAA